MSTLPVRAVPRYGAAIMAATAVTGFALYQRMFPRAVTGRCQDLISCALFTYITPADNTEAPLLLEGKKTLAGEKGTASERSFVMVRLESIIERNAAHSPDQA